MTPIEAWIFLICATIPFLIVLIYVGNKIANSLEALRDVVCDDLNGQLDRMNEDICNLEDEISNIYGRLEGFKETGSSEDETSHDEDIWRLVNSIVEEQRELNICIETVSARLDRHIKDTSKADDSE